MRHIPIFTFINKMDRDANDTFDLLDEIEKELGIATCPINWPIGSGKGFKGVYDRNTKEVMTFSDTLKGTKEGTERHIHIDDPALVDEIGEAAKEKLLEEIELLDGASAEFDMDLVSKGELSPVIFWFRVNKLWCGDIFTALFENDVLSASEKSRYRGDRSVSGRFLCVCVQDSGEYEQSAP